jgi:transcription initiation factor IIE alpha subunit
MVSKKNNQLTTYKQGRFTCLACGISGRLKAAFNMNSVCPKCGDYMILPNSDLTIISEHDKVVGEAQLSAFEASLDAEKEKK